MAIAKELLPRLRFYWKNRLNDRNYDGAVNLLDVAIVMRGYGANIKARRVNKIKKLRKKADKKYSQEFMIQQEERIQKLIAKHEKMPVKIQLLPCC